MKPTSADRRSPEGWSASLGGLAPGHAIGPYELLVPIAFGGMAFVWAAKTRESSRIVAIKTLLPSLSSDPRFEKMFLEEGKLAMRVRHPSVCEVVATGEDRGLYYLVMDWVDGDSLAAITGEMGARVPCPIAARIAVEIAEGLHAAHESVDEEGAPIGLVHRDVSPQNILISIDGTSKIADFGIAKATRAGAPHTMPGYAKGKVRYMAPEQVYCEDVDRRTDVFALGVVLYEATTGAHPFDAGEDVAMLAKLAAPEAAPAPIAIVPDYPAALSAVVSRAIAKSPEDRYASMEDFALALAECEVATRDEVALFVGAAPGSRARDRRSAIEDAIAGRSSPTATSKRPGGRSPARAIVLWVAAACAAMTALWAFESRHVSVPPAAADTPLRPPLATAIPIAPVAESAPIAPPDPPRVVATPHSPRPPSSPLPPVVRRPPAPTPSPSATVITDVLGTRD